MTMVGQGLPSASTVGFLPGELLEFILGHLKKVGEKRDICSVASVNSHWRRFARPFMWEVPTKRQITALMSILSLSERQETANSIRELSLTDAPYANEHARRVVPLFKSQDCQFPRLKKLFLVDDYERWPLRRLASLFPESLKCVDLYPSSGASACMTNSLNLMRVNCPHLKQIGVGGPGLTADEALEFFKATPSIEHITVRSTSLSNIDLIAHLVCRPNLRCFQTMMLIGGEHLQAWNGTLPFQVIERLRVRLYDHTRRERVVAGFFNAIYHATTLLSLNLEVDSRTVTTRTIEYTKKLPGPLQRLTVKFSLPTVLGTASLAALAHHKKTLKALEITCQRIDYPMDTPQLSAPDWSASQIVDTLSDMPKLQKLQLDIAKMKMSSEDIVKLGKTLPNLKSLCFGQLCINLRRILRLNKDPWLPNLQRLNVLQFLEVNEDTEELSTTDAEVRRTRAVTADAVWASSLESRRAEAKDIVTFWPNLALFSVGHRVRNSYGDELVKAVRWEIRARPNPMIGNF